MGDVMTLDFARTVPAEPLPAGFTRRGFKQHLETQPYELFHHNYDPAIERQKPQWSFRCVVSLPVFTDVKRAFDSDQVSFEHLVPEGVKAERVERTVYGLVDEFASWPLHGVNAQRVHAIGKSMHHALNDLLDDFTLVDEVADAASWLGRYPGGLVQLTHSMTRADYHPRLQLVTLGSRGLGETIALLLGAQEVPDLGTAFDDGPYRNRVGNAHNAVHRLTQHGLAYTTSACRNLLYPGNLFVFDDGMVPHASK